MHDYLFGSNVFGCNAEFVEYYVQLMKTILMRISEHQCNRFLIRMFCNERYPTFPLLTNATILAVSANELIKVTAQQCILIIVGLINEQQIHTRYLS
jgi:hypothetical protein